MEQIPPNDGDEFSAMQLINDRLEPLEESARQRVLGWANSKFGFAPVLTGGRRAVGAMSASAVDQREPADTVGSPTFGAFAELYEAAQPHSQPERALVAGYWLQVVGATEAFASQSLNDLLKNLGAGVGNITQALDSLKGASPALVLQIKKSGKSKQSRKLYKLTVPGIRAVEAMIHGST